MPPTWYLPAQCWTNNGRRIECCRNRKSKPNVAPHLRMIDACVSKPEPTSPTPTTTFIKGALLVSAPPPSSAQVQIHTHHCQVQVHGPDLIWWAMSHPCRSTILHSLSSLLHSLLKQLAALLLQVKRRPFLMASRCRMETRLRRCLSKCSALALARRLLSAGGSSDGTT